MRKINTNIKAVAKMEDDARLLLELENTIRRGEILHVASLLEVNGVEHPLPCKKCMGRWFIGYKTVRRMRQPVLCNCLLKYVKNREFKMEEDSKNE